MMILYTNKEREIWLRHPEVTFLKYEVNMIFSVKYADLGQWMIILSIDLHHLHKGYRCFRELINHILFNYVNSLMEVSRVNQHTVKKTWFFRHLQTAFYFFQAHFIV